MADVKFELSCEKGRAPMCTSKAEGGGRCPSEINKSIERAEAALGQHFMDQAMNPDKPVDGGETERLKKDIHIARFELRTTASGFAEGQDELVAATATRDAAKECAGGELSQLAPEERAREVVHSSQALAGEIRDNQAASKKRFAAVQAGAVGERTAKALQTIPHTAAQQERVQDVNGQWRATTVIGAVTVDEPYMQTWTRQNEFALNESRKILPGTYPVRLDDQTGDVSWTLDAAPPPPGKDKTPGGAPTTITHSIYGHTMPSESTQAASFSDGGSLILHKGVSVVRRFGAFPNGRLTSSSKLSVTDAQPGDDQPDEHVVRRSAEKAATTSG